jgi:hypothetical protein
VSDILGSSLAWLPRIHGTIETLCTMYGVPYGVALGWIQVESGGRLGETTSLDERGYFQLMPDESKEIGVDHQRLSTDSDYSLEAGFKLIAYYAKVVRSRTRSCNVNVMDGSEFFWRLVKLGHSMGGGSLSMILRDAATANAATDWNAFSSFLRAHDGDYLHRLKHSPVKWLGLIDRMFAIGRPYGVDRSVSVPPAAVS